MAKYYVNRTAKSNGDHEVHKDGCQWMPGATNRIDLGDFDDCARSGSSEEALYAG